ncbi:MAG TPA: protein-L-isoaspartate(D-aspartate) O-methyltransferase [Dehalococcoidia bacterium]|nr:protein-L-isoaspartate(D-aspartate) O-methyltransferase [Dehalococcoidia bacterium]
MDFDAARARLIKKISSEIKDRRVLEVMSRIPREVFVSEGVRYQAYEDKPLPIGYEQTISQPYIIALMTEALEIKGTEKVLELGTGSGYQTAILAELAREVVSVERVPELAESAKEVLDKLGYKNIHIYIAGEELGRKQDAPYDAIMVTAGAPRIPDDLVSQLAEGGNMIIPVGTRYMQELCKVTKCGGRTTVRNLGGCRFVSLIGKDAWGK